MPRACTVLEPWPFDQPLPSVLTPHDLMRVLRLRPAMFYRYQARGDFRHLEVKRPIGHGRYSGALVDKHRRGDSTVQFVRRTA